MVTKKKTPAKKRKARRASIGTVDFLKIYTPMVRDGKSAKEIGKAMDRDATFVCVKASQLRISFRQKFEKGKITQEQLDATLARIPCITGGDGTPLVDQIAALDLGGDSVPENVSDSHVETPAGDDPQPTDGDAGGS